MTLETAKQAVRYACENYSKHKDDRRYSNPEIIFFGGEPLLRFYDLIKPLVEWIKTDDWIWNQSGIRFSITTNGYLLNEEILKFMSENRFDMLLSFDGCPEVQNDQRKLHNGNITSEIVESKFPLIFKYLPETCMRATIQPRNANKMIDMYLYARQKGFVGFCAAPNASGKWDETAKRDVMIGLSQFVAVWVYDILNDGNPLWWKNFNEEACKIVSKEIEKNQNPTFKSKIERCGLGLFSCGVDVCGNLVGCQEHSSSTLDDLFFIGDVWSGIDETKHFELLKKYLERDHNICRQNNKRCENCSYYNSCFTPLCQSRDLEISGEIGVQEEITCLWSDFLRRALILAINELSENESDFKKFLKYLDGEVST